MLNLNDNLSRPVIGNNVLISCESYTVTLPIILLENISSVMDMVKVIPLMSINFGLLSSLSCLYEIIDNSDKLYLPASV